jgi:hypothetical protein
MNSFQLVGISPQPFEHLFDLTDSQLAEIGAVRCTAEQTPGFPCRISLEDAQVGEEVLLLPYAHQPAATPYRSSGPIFVRRGVQQKTVDAGVIPPYVSGRLMSVRAYDDHDMMVDASVCEGTSVGDEIMKKFDDERVVYIHLHNAKRGCFSCRVDRAS